jgi:hypothetical protein
MATLERHYKIREIARRWNVSDRIVRRIFAAEPVLRIGKPSRLVGGPHRKYIRRYWMMRVPVSVLRRVENRMKRDGAIFGFRCPIHPRAILVCSACKGKEGGRATGRKYSHEQLVRWGRSGGRPKKVDPTQKRAS